eukprot:scpid44566/ scgid20205/ 
MTLLRTYIAKKTSVVMNIMPTCLYNSKFRNRFALTAKVTSGKLIDYLNNCIADILESEWIRVLLPLQGNQKCFAGLGFSLNHELSDTFRGSLRGLEVNILR